MSDGEQSRGPLCFVVMPYGRKTDASGLTMDFDAIHRDLIRPGILGAGMTPVRADEERTGGIIHQQLFERLILCDYAVADLTMASANVCYELGIRHGVRPASTVLLFADGMRLPFDLGPMRAVTYKLDESGVPTDLETARQRLTELLREARKRDTDSPVFQLVRDLDPPGVSHVQTDLFRERVRRDESIKDELAVARMTGLGSVEAVRASLGEISDTDPGVLVDLLLSYRSLGAWDRMADLVDELPEPLRSTPRVREQYGLALNRAGRGEEAERVLTRLLEERGPSSETYGVLGRVYKDRWKVARDEGKRMLAVGLLGRAIDAYINGFQSDWRDAYPGVNALTLTYCRDVPDPGWQQLHAVVEYSVRQKLAGGQATYWDHASLLELHVLAGDQAAAASALAEALALSPEQWQTDTTRANLQLIREAGGARGEDVEWLREIEDTL